MKNILLRILFILLFVNTSYSQTYTAEKYNNGFQFREVTENGWGCIYEISHFETYFKISSHSQINFKINKVVYNNEEIKIEENRYYTFGDGEYLVTLNKDFGKQGLYTLKLVFKDNEIVDILHNNKSIIVKNGTYDDK